MQPQTTTKILEILNQQISCKESPYGIGMRDIIGHGLRSDKGLQSDDSLAVWWFTLHLVCLFIPELYKRNHE